MKKSLALAVSLGLGLAIVTPVTAQAGSAPGSNSVKEVRIPVVDDPSTMDQLGKQKYESDTPGTDGWAPKGQRVNVMRKPASIAATNGTYILPPDDGGGSYPSSAYVAANQQDQQTNYWCGPATMVETLYQHPGATSGSQTWAAGQLGTTTSGTTKDAMQRELNQWSGGFPYDRIDLPYTPSSTDVANFKSHLKQDMYQKAGIAGVAYEVYNGPRLKGHPNLRNNIYHYFNIRGYSSDAADTSYEDSARSVWATVPPYSTMSTSTIVTIMGGRGYHW